MNLWRKLIHQTSAWRFVAAGGGDTASSRASRFIEQNSFKLLCASFVLVKYWRIQSASRLSVVDSMFKSDYAFSRAMDAEGVTWEFCKVKVAELKQKTKSLSASKHDRFALQIYEEWLEMHESGRVLSAC